MKQIYALILLLSFVLLSLGGCYIQGSGGGPSTSTASVTVVDINAVDMAYDPSRSLVYFAASSADPVYPSMIVPVNLRSLQVNQNGPIPVSVGAVPTAVAVSGDGNYLYVGTATGAIYRIILSTGAVDTLFATLPTGTVAMQMVPIPNTPNSFAVRTYNNTLAADSGTLIYDGLVPRTNTAMLGLSIAVKGDASQIFGFTASTGVYTVAKLAPVGITIVTPTFTTGDTSTPNSIHWNNGNLVLDDGVELDPASGVQISKLKMPFGASTEVVPVPGGMKDYVVTSGTSPQFVLTYLHGMLLPSPTVTAKGTGVVVQSVDVGSHSLVYRTNAGVAAVASHLP